MSDRRPLSSARARHGARAAGAGTVGVLGVAAVFAVAPQAAHAAPHHPADTSTSPTASHTTGDGAPRKIAPRVDPNYGMQKYRVGVKLKDGSYAPTPTPPKTTTGGSTLTVTEAGPNAPTTNNPFTCTTSDATVDSDGVTYCTQTANAITRLRALAREYAPQLITKPTPGLQNPAEYFYAQAGDTITVTQTTAPADLVKDPSTGTIDPCTAPAQTPLVRKPALAPAPNCPPADGQFNELSTDLVFEDKGLPPVAADDSAQAPFDGRTTIDVLANDDTKGAPVTGLSVSSAPSDGTATVVSTSKGKQIRYVPRKGFYGSDSFKYTLSTANGDATATVTVTVPAPPPVAKDDSADTTANQAVTVNVLANDETKGADINGVRVTTAPKHGTAHVVSTPSGPRVRYTPATDFVGTDTFEYTLRTDGGSSTATVTIHVSAPPPTAVDDSASTKSGQAVTVAVTSNDSANGGGAITVTSVSKPGHGSATIDGQNVDYTPADNFVGTDTFTYTISTSGGTDTATVTVTVTGSGALANTGVDSAALLGLGGGLLIVGGAATVAGRRRRAARHASLG